MQSLVLQWLPESLSPYASWIIPMIALTTIAITVMIVHFILHKLVLRTLEGLTRNSQKVWKKTFFERKLFHRAVFLIQGGIVYAQAGIWLSDDSVVHGALQFATHLWMLHFALLTTFSLLDGILDIANGTRIDRIMPLRGIFQGIKLIASILVGILIISLLIGKSPLILMSGLGAMTAVILLVFKDAILGLVAGIQLSANHMLSKGDWLEMAKYNANGSVIDIGLTTVKVRNFDNSITTIPTYALISDSFRNWRGMTESGARRINRSLSLDVRTLRFLKAEEIQQLKTSRYLASYFERKETEISQYHKDHQVGDTPSRLDQRNLTNIGTLRAYLEAYLRAHPGIHAGMTLMVRQLEPDEHGLPLDIYAFTNTTVWEDYESIQSDIFDHIFAILPEFGLRAHQSPTGHDITEALQR